MKKRRKKIKIKKEEKKFTYIYIIKKESKPLLLCAREIERVRPAGDYQL